MESGFLTMKEMIERLKVLKVRTRQGFYQKYSKKIHPVKRVGNKNYYSEQQIQSLITAELSGQEQSSLKVPDSLPLDPYNLLNERVLNDLLDEKKRLRDDNDRLKTQVHSLGEAAQCLQVRLESMVPLLEHRQTADELQEAQEVLSDTVRQRERLSLELDEARRREWGYQCKVDDFDQLRSIEQELETLSIFSFRKKRRLRLRREELLFTDVDRTGDPRHDNCIGKISEQAS
jgi:hypothetical protein